MDLLVDRQLGCFHLLASVNSALVNVEEDVSLRDFLFLEYIYTNMLEHMVALFLGFWGTLFSTMSVLIYIPTKSMQGFPFLHILASICYLSSF